MSAIKAYRSDTHSLSHGQVLTEPYNADDARIVVEGLDAVDGTPVLDIKPYYPVYDRKDASVPEWVDRLMEHYF
jgi:tRNA (Thr-GGU) A37 N-methylase